MTKQVLYISYDGMTDPLGQSQVLPYLQGLSEAGYAVTLLSFEKKEAFASGKEPIADICNKAGIRWIPFPWKNTPPVISTIRNIRRINHWIDQMQGNTPFDLVHCRSYISALAGLRMKKKWGTRFLFDPRGFFADERVDGGVWKLSNPLYVAIYRYFKRKELLFYKYSDHIISLTHKGKEAILQTVKGAIPAEKITVIPCCADTTLFSSEKIEPLMLQQLIDKTGTKDRFVITYLGAVGTWYLTDKMMELYALLRKKIPHTVFLFITAENPLIVTAEAEKFGIPAEEIIVRRSPRNLVPYYLELSDVGVFFIKPAYSKKASSPTKLGELLSMGLPVICNAGVGDVEEIIATTQTGYCIHTFSEKEMLEAIQKILLLQNKKQNRLMAENAIHFFSLTEGISRYKGVYEKLLGTQA